MNFDPTDIRLERTDTIVRAQQFRPRSATKAQHRSTSLCLVSPAAFDEVFAALSKNSDSVDMDSSPAPPRSPSLNTAPLIALSVSLHQQHERLNNLLRDIDASVSA
ncbi:MAG TPA: hypothetical protein VGI40_21315 [Pirellulaceae bacterium]